MLDCRGAGEVTINAMMQSLGHIDDKSDVPWPDDGFNDPLVALVDRASFGTSRDVISQNTV